MEKEQSWLEQVEQEVREEMSLAGEVLFSIPAYDCEKTNPIVDEYPMYQSVQKTIDEQIDELEAAILNDCILVDCPLKHVFSPGLYTRTILMVKGAVLTSMVHRNEHQYIVSKGVALVRVGEGEWKRISAPYIDKTPPGARRVLYIEEECIWTSIHHTKIQPLNDTKEAFDLAVEAVENEIYVQRENPLLGGFIKGNTVIKTIDKWQDGQQQLLG